MSTRKRRGSAKPTSVSKRKKAVGDDAFDWSGGKDDEVIPSDSDAKSPTSGESEDESDEEDPQEKRIRLAKGYLDNIKAQEGQGFGDEGDELDEKVSSRLQEDAMEAMGKTFKQVADYLEEFEFDEESTKFLKGHRLPVTSVCLSEDGRTAFSSAKDGSIFKWELATSKKSKFQLPADDEAGQKAITDHERAVYSLALSSDGKFLVSGGADRLVRVWDPVSNELQESFSGHRDTVSSVVFRRKSHALFSGSFDRSVKQWNLTDMGYVESLFGHQAEVQCLASLHKERVVSCGRDHSVRFWKIPEETQLVFHGNQGCSLDCIAMVTEESYVTGGDDGSLTLWSNGRKKPLHVVENAHGGKWINSVAVLPRSDLVASGSSDGVIRLWKADLQARSLTQVATIPMTGHVNALCFDEKARFLLAGVGKEHRFGRWECLKKAPNGLAIVALPSLSDDAEAEEEDEDSEVSEKEDA